MNEIYLDHASTTKPAGAVLYAMHRAQATTWGNPGSLHRVGTAAAEAVRRARNQLSDTIGAHPDQILFNASASEANSHAILGLAAHLKAAGKTHIITTQVEHASVLSAMRRMEAMGFSVTYLPVNSRCELSYRDFLRAITPSTGLVSVMLVNNETGAIFPCRRIGRACRAKHILFHTDCTQAFGSFPVNVQYLHADLASFSAHKIKGPKGIGALYASHYAQQVMTPLICGGDQENGLRGGTHNVPAIVGFGKAVELIGCSRINDIYKTDLRTQRLFRACLKRRAKESGIKIEFVIPRIRTGKITNFRIAGVDSETLQTALSAQGIYVSTGSACHSTSNTPSHVLTAMGMTEDEARSSIRVSISGENTIMELIEAADAIVNTAKALQDLQG